MEPIRSSQFPPPCFLLRGETDFLKNAASGGGITNFPQPRDDEKNLGRVLPGET